MFRMPARIYLLMSTVIVAVAIAPVPVSAVQISGHYMEARTCQVYTGPCFANGEVGLAGKDALMAWSIKEGQYQNTDLAGMNVILLVRASDTLGFGGVEDAESARFVIVVDDQATGKQREALVAFATQQAGASSDNVARVHSSPISMELNIAKLTGKLRAGDMVKLQTRKARKGDCICSNESAYYPPLASLQNSVPGVTIQGNVRAGGLGGSWSIPDSRTAYMGTFEQ